MNRLVLGEALDGQPAQLCMNCTRMFDDVHQVFKPTSIRQTLSNINTGDWAGWPSQVHHMHPAEVYAAVERGCQICTPLLDRISSRGLFDLRSPLSSEMQFTRYHFLRKPTYLAEGDDEEPVLEIMLNPESTATIKNRFAQRSYETSLKTEFFLKPLKSERQNVTVSMMANIETRFPIFDNTVWFSSLDWL